MSFAHQELFFISAAIFCGQKHKGGKSVSIHLPAAVVYESKLKREGGEKRSREIRERKISTLLLLLLLLLLLPFLLLCCCLVPLPSKHCCSAISKKRGEIFYAPKMERLCSSPANLCSKVLFLALPAPSVCSDSIFSSGPRAKAAEAEL